MTPNPQRGYLKTMKGWTAVKNTHKLHYFVNPTSGNYDDKFSLCGKYFWDDSLKAFVDGHFSTKSYCEICLKKSKKVAV